MTYLLTQSYIYFFNTLFNDYVIFNLSIMIVQSQIKVDLKSQIIFHK